MSGEIPPSVAAFRFNAIGGRSLRDRLSSPDPHVQTSPVDEEEEEDDLYVDMDIDVEMHSLGDQPSLLARLGELPSDHLPFNAQDAHLPTSCSGEVSPAASDRRTDPTLFTTTSDPALSNSRDNASIHTSPIVAQTTLTFQGLPTPPHSGASAPLYTNEQLQIPNSHFSPTRTTAALFSPFPYTPLNELLQDERDAWGEAWKAKLNRPDNSFASVQATDFTLTLPGLSQVETSTSDFLGVVGSNIPSISRNEISVPSVPPMRDLTRKENDESGKMESTSFSISNDRDPSMGKKADSSTSHSEPSKLLVSSAISPEIERDSLSHPTTLPHSQSDSMNTGERHQMPDSDKNDVGVDQLAPARTHSVNAQQPREHELKAVLKARKSSDCPKDVTSTNQRRSSSESGSLPTMQKPKFWRDQPRRPSQEAGRTGFVDNRSTRIGSGTAPSCLPTRSTSKEDASRDIRLLEAQAHNLGASDFSSRNSGSTAPFEHRASILQPSRPSEDDNAMRASKRQAKKSEASCRTAIDGSSGLTTQTIAKTERTPSLPAKPTFHSISQKSTNGFPRTEFSAAKFKRSRSPGIKSEPADDGSPSCEPNSRPMKRMKEEHTTSGTSLKKEELEENISETSTLGDPASTQDARIEHQVTNAKSVGDECSTIETLQDQQGNLRGVFTSQSLAAATQEHSEIRLAPRTLAAQPRAVLTHQERAPSDDVISRRIPAMDSSSSNIGRGDQGTLDSEMRTGTIGNSPLRVQAGLFQDPTDLSGRRNLLHSETKLQQPQGRSEQTSRTQSHSSQPVPASPAFPTPNEGWTQRSDIIRHRSPEDMSFSDNCRRSYGGSPQSRGRSHESRPMLVDHWSPPRPAIAIRQRVGNTVADTYRPSRSPPPARGSERTGVGYGRQYDRGRTPPRNSWRGRRRDSSRGSRSPIPRGSARYSSYSRSPPPRRYIRGLSPRPRPFPRRLSPINATQSPRPQYANSSSSGGFSSTTREIPRPSLHTDAKDNAPVPSSDLDTVSECRSPANHGAAYSRSVLLEDAGRSTVVEKVPGPGPRDQARVNTPVDIASTQGQFAPHSTSAFLIASVERFNIAGDAKRPYNTVSPDMENSRYAVQTRQANGHPQLQDGGRYDHARPTESSPGIETSSDTPNAVHRVDPAQLTSSSSVVSFQNAASTNISSAQDLASNLPDTAAEPRLADLHSQQTASTSVPQYRYVDPIDSFTLVGTKEDDDDRPDERTPGKDDDQGEQSHANMRGPSDSTRPPRFNVPNGQGARESTPPVNERSPVDHHLSTPSPKRKKTKKSRPQHNTQVQFSPPGKNTGKSHTQTENSVRSENSNVRSLAARIGSEQKNSPHPDTRDQTTIDTPKSSTPHVPSLASRLATTSTTHERLQLGDRIAGNPVSPSNTNSLMSRLNDPPSLPALGAPLPVKPFSHHPGDRTLPRPNSPSLLDRMRSPRQSHEAERRWEPRHPPDREDGGYGRGRGRGRAQNRPQGSYSSSKRSLKDRFS